MTSSGSANGRAVRQVSTVVANRVASGSDTADTTAPDTDVDSTRTCSAPITPAPITPTLMIMQSPARSSATRGRPCVETRLRPVRLGSIFLRLVYLFCGAKGLAEGGLAAITSLLTSPLIPV